MSIKSRLERLEKLTANKRSGERIPMTTSHYRAIVHAQQLLHLRRMEAFLAPSDEFALLMIGERNARFMSRSEVVEAERLFIEFTRQVGRQPVIVRQVLERFIALLEPFGWLVKFSPHQYGAEFSFTLDLFNGQRLSFDFMISKMVLICDKDVIQLASYHARDIMCKALRMVEEGLNPAAIKANEPAKV